MTGSVHIIAELVTGSNCFGTMGHESFAKSGFKNVFYNTYGFNSSSNMIQQAARTCVEGRRANAVNPLDPNNSGPAHNNIQHWIDISEIRMSASERTSIRDLIEYRDSASNTTTDRAHAEGLLVERIWDLAVRENERVDSQQAAEVRGEMQRAGLTRNNNPAGDRIAVETTPVAIIGDRVLKMDILFTSDCLPVIATSNYILSYNADNALTATPSTSATPQGLSLSAAMLTSLATTLLSMKEPQRRSALEALGLSANMTIENITAMAAQVLSQDGYAQRMRCAAALLESIENPNQREAVAEALGMKGMTAQAAKAVADLNIGSPEWKAMSRNAQDLRIARTISDSEFEGDMDAQNAINDQFNMDSMETVTDFLMLAAALNTLAGTELFDKISLADMREMARTGDMASRLEGLGLQDAAQQDKDKVAEAVDSLRREMMDRSMQDIARGISETIDHLPGADNKISGALAMLAESLRKNGKITKEELSALAAAINAYGGSLSVAQNEAVNELKNSIDRIADTDEGSIAIGLLGLASLKRGAARNIAIPKDAEVLKREASRLEEAAKMVMLGRSYDRVLKVIGQQDLSSPTILSQNPFLSAGKEAIRSIEERVRMAGNMLTNNLLMEADALPGPANTQEANYVNLRNNLIQAAENVKTGKYDEAARIAEEMSSEVRVDQWASKYPGAGVGQGGNIRNSISSLRSTVEARNGASKLDGSLKDLADKDSFRATSAQQQVARQGDASQRPQSKRAENQKAEAARIKSYEDAVGVKDYEASRKKIVSDMADAESAAVAAARSADGKGIANAAAQFNEARNKLGVDASAAVILAEMFKTAIGKAIFGEAGALKADMGRQLYDIIDVQMESLDKIPAGNREAVIRAVGSTIDALRSELSAEGAASVLTGALMDIRNLKQELRRTGLNNIAGIVGTLNQSIKDRAADAGIKESKMFAKIRDIAEQMSDVENDVESPELRGIVRAAASLAVRAIIAGTDRAKEEVSGILDDLRSELESAGLEGGALERALKAVGIVTRLAGAAEVGTDMMNRVMSSIEGKNRAAFLGKARLAARGEGQVTEGMKLDIHLGDKVALLEAKAEDAGKSIKVWASERAKDIAAQFGISDAAAQRIMAQSIVREIGTLTDGTPDTKAVAEFDSEGTILRRGTSHEISTELEHIHIHIGSIASLDQLIGDAAALIVEKSGKVRNGRAASERILILDATGKAVGGAILEMTMKDGKVSSFTLTRIDRNGKETTEDFTPAQMKLAVVWATAVARQLGVEQPAHIIADNGDSAIITAKEGARDNVAATHRSAESGAGRVSAPSTEGEGTGPGEADRALIPTADGVAGAARDLREQVMTIDPDNVRGLRGAIDAIGQAINSMNALKDTKLDSSVMDDILGSLKTALAAANALKGGSTIENSNALKVALEAVMDKLVNAMNDIILENAAKAGEDSVRALRAELSAKGAGKDVRIRSAEDGRLPDLSDLARLVEDTRSLMEGLVQAANAENIETLRRFINDRLPKTAGTESAGGVSRTASKGATVTGPGAGTAAYESYPVSAGVLDNPAALVKDIRGKVLAAKDAGRVTAAALQVKTEQDRRIANKLRMEGIEVLILDELDENMTPEDIASRVASFVTELIRKGNAVDLFVLLNRNNERTAQLIRDAMEAKAYNSLWILIRNEDTSFTDAARLLHAQLLATTSAGITEAGAKKLDRIFKDDRDVAVVASPQQAASEVDQSLDEALTADIAY
jgi:hypothetical protein